MKFGTKISNDLYDEWRLFYLDYNRLKRELKTRTTSLAGWTEKDEREFISMLTLELDKIHDFQKAKACSPLDTAELSQRIREAEKEVQQLVVEERETSQVENGDQPRSDLESSKPRESDYHHDEGSDDDLSDGDGASEDESFEALEERFHALEEEVAILVADVHDLALYTKLNITGFMKILKKQTKIQLKSTFIQDYLEKRAFYKYNWDAIIVKLSKLYDLVRTRGHPVQGDSSAGGSQSAFVRQTTKYWVHQDNLLPLKLAILRHLPVLVFNSDKEFEPKDSAITSIYFDNEELELYLGRLEKTEGAEAIRMRWYGDVDNKTIFVERKTHREDWTGEKSVKARFPLKEHLVVPFVKGEYTVDADFQELVKKGKKTQAEVDGMIQLANEVQYAILTKRLQPVMRSFYNRTAFQLPGDARVRISLDTELTLIREDNWDGKIRAGDNWRRTDIGIDFPFDQVDKEDKEIFKYGVLEVKLQTQLGQQPPKWITDLVSSHLVEAVPKFSKFIHGCATLLPERVDLVPFWLPQMDVDILKPDTGYLSVIERPTGSSATTSKNTTPPSPSVRTSPPSSSGGSNSPIVVPNYTEPLSEGEDEDADALGEFGPPAPARDVDKRTGLTGDEVKAAIEYREQMLKEEEAAARKKEKQPETIPPGDANGAPSTSQDHPPASPISPSRPKIKQEKSTISRKLKNKSLSINPLAPSTAFDETLKTKLEGAQEEQTRLNSAGPSRSRSRSPRAKKPRRQSSENAAEEGEADDEEAPANGAYGRDAGIGDDRVLDKSLRAPEGKRISVPVRIEPKVYFANERTFLKWLNNAVFVGTIATTLLNFIPPDDTQGLISAAFFTFAALLAIAYSAGIFIYRSYRLRERRANGLYYDKYGPTIFCGVLFLALATNIGLRWSQL